MNKEVVLLLLTGIFFLIVLFVFLYRKRFSGKPQGGLHLQAIGLTLAWIGGVLAFAMDRVEHGAKAVLIGFAIGLVGLFVQTQRKGE